MDTLFSLLYHWNYIINTAGAIMHLTEDSKADTKFVPDTLVNFGISYRGPNISTKFKRGVKIVKLQHVSEPP